MSNIKLLFIIIVSLSLFSSCSSDDPLDNIDNPVSYDFTRDGISTVSFSGQTDRISMATELITAMKDFSVSEETLLEMYANETVAGTDANPFSDATLNASTKSVKSKVAASEDFFSSNTVASAEIKADIASWITAQVTEVFPNQNVLATPGTAGQIADGSTVRYISATGLEYNQVVNKSLIGALMVDQMLNNYLSVSVLDEADNIDNNDNNIVEEGKPYTTMEHKWDEAYGYLFGAAEANHTNPLSTLGIGDFLNKYLSRVDGDSDFTGIANDIYEALKLGRAAIVAKEYEVRNEQANIIKEKVSQLTAIRAVFYLQQGKIARENSDVGGAFHDLSEGLGFIYSLRFTRQPNSINPYFTESEVDGFIDQLTGGNGLWDLTQATLDQMSNDIAVKFAFNVQQAGE